MKYVFLSSLVLVSVFISSGTVLAHSENTNRLSNSDTGAEVEMMQNNVNEDLKYKKMEDLMVKMMTNTMTQEEAREMITLMQDMDGGMGSMMGMGKRGDHGMGENEMFGFDSGYGMHKGIGILGVLVHLVFLILGILGIVWLWRRIGINELFKK